MNAFLLLALWGSQKRMGLGPISIKHGSLTILILVANEFLQQNISDKFGQILTLFSRFFYICRAERIEVLILQQLDK